MNRSDDPAAAQLAAQPAARLVLPNIQAASRNTGVSFSYLMAQAGKESAFESEAGSHASSAAGLFQFTRATWLQLVKAHGAEHGLTDLADQIHKGSKGEYTVSDPKTRQQILDLRRDPQISSLMAGEYAKDNKSRLEKALGRPVDSTDLYMAHFLGPGGAARVLKARAQDPAQPADALLPQAARKNPSVFYDTNHTPRSVAAVYEKIHHTIDGPMRQFAQVENNPEAVQQVASAASSASRPWPFETGQWPPAYLPEDSAPTATADAGPAESTVAAAEPIADAARPQQIAYTDVRLSADQISQPMPPRPGNPQADGLVKMLKSLFG